MSEMQEGLNYEGEILLYAFVLTEGMHGVLGVQGIPSTPNSVFFVFFGIPCEMPKIILRNFAECRVIGQHFAEYRDFRIFFSPKGTHTKAPVVQAHPGAGQAPVV
jgi:hypothetical protein